MPGDKSASLEASFDPILNASVREGNRCSLSKECSGEHTRARVGASPPKALEIGPSPSVPFKACRIAARDLS